MFVEATRLRIQFVTINMGWPRGSARNSGVTCQAYEATRFNDSCRRKQITFDSSSLPLAGISAAHLWKCIALRYTRSSGRFALVKITIPPRHRPVMFNVPASPARGCWWPPSPAGATALRQTPTQLAKVCRVCILLHTAPNCQTLAARKSVKEWLNLVRRRGRAYLASAHPEEPRF